MIYLIGEIFSKLFPFLLLPYLTRQLGPAEYGSLSYFMAVITLLSIIIGLVQQDVVSRFYFFYGNKSVYNILFAGITLSTIMYMSVVSIGIYFKHPVLSLLATVALFQSLLQAGLSLLQCQKKAFNYVLIQSLVTLIGFFATLFFFEFIQKDAEYRIISLAIGNAIGYLILLFFLLRRKKFKIKPLIFHRYIIHAICYAAPLIIHHLSYYVKGQFDRVFINNHFSSAQLGVYSAGLQLSMILPVLLMALAKGGIPYYYEMIKFDKINPHQIIKYSILALLICMLPAVLAYAIPKNIYVFLLGTGYTDAKYYCVFFLMCFAFNGGYLLLANHLFYLAKSKIVVAANLLSAVIYILLLYFFAKRGLTYIPFAMMFSNGVLYIIVAFLYYRYVLNVHKIRSV